MNRFSLSDRPTKEEVNLLHEHMHAFNLSQTGGEFDQPGIEINQLIKDPQGRVVGGVNASTLYRVMHLEVLWVADEYRKFGLARSLVLAAEEIGAQNGCLSTQTMSFSFQAPGFYQKLGYKVLGIYSGYPFGIREYVLNKRLDPATEGFENESQFEIDGIPGQFTQLEEITPEEMDVLHKGLHAHVVENIGERYQGMRIRLVAKDGSGVLAGGLVGYTTIDNLILESLWVEEKYRGGGTGSCLLGMAEEIAKKNGCIASQAICLSFQGIKFLTRRGFEVYGVSDSYPAPVEEYHLIKQLV